MVIGIVGLGLIGGSLAKASKKYGNYTVYAYDIQETSLQKALEDKAIDSPLTEKNISACDYIFISLYPKAVIEFVEKHAALFQKDAVVIDCAGVKRSVCEPCFRIAEQHGFTFIGGHPMAGTQFSGYEHAKDTMFWNAPFVLTPKQNEDVLVLAKAREVIISLGFGRVSVMTPERHDKLIAFTSQLAHVVSNAYVKSPSAPERKGISAGSYKDLTRVAYLNETMWAELFLDNHDHLTAEIDHLIVELQKYSQAMKTNDFDTLRELLKEGKIAKEQAD
ncbi:MAG: prephenate dehydrogenase/arogenate dehydrogenase family protein [Clostridiales bacterium]|nr:prephenate dehydrogenase/arogenate dehydrogenase family protein [Clostridiales bacterium]